MERELTQEELDRLPVLELSRHRVVMGIHVSTAMDKIGFVHSVSEAQRAMSEGSVSLNGVEVGIDMLIKQHYFMGETALVLRVGNKRTGLIGLIKMIERD